MIGIRPLIGIILALAVCVPTVSAAPTYTYEQMTDDLIRMAQTYPDLVHVKVIGKTPYHRNIYAVSLGNGPASAVLSASQHAREWITTCLVIKMMDAYCSAYEHNQRIGGYPVRPILNESTLWFVPMANPDGVALQQRGPSAFPPQMHDAFINWNRGNRDFTEWKANAQGIDLNRQYDGEWDKLKTGSHGPAAQGYKGKRPFEAGEVKALVNFLKEVNPAAEVAYHASGNVIFCHSSESRYPVVRDLADLTGYRVVDIDDSYGGLTDWWTQTLGKQGITIEVGPFYGEKPVPLTYIKDIWNRNQTVGLYLAARATLQREQSVATTSP